MAETPFAMQPTTSHLTKRAKTPKSKLKPELNPETKAKREETR